MMIPINRILGSALLVLATIGEGSSAMLAHPQRRPGNATDDDATKVKTRPDPASVVEYKGVQLSYLRYAGFKIEYQGTVVYIDPLFIWELEEPLLEPGDFIVVTHAHLTHCSPRDISALSDQGTVTIGSPDVANTSNTANNKRHLTPDHIARPGDSLVFDEVGFEFVPMYNIDPTRTWAHPQGTEDFGVIVELGGVRIYHASDTDRIPELAEVRADIALLPVSGYAEMGPEEAAEAAHDLMSLSNLEYAIPMHWNSYTGDIFDAYRFYELAPGNVVILTPITDDPLPPARSIPR